MWPASGRDVVHLLRDSTTFEDEEQPRRAGTSSHHPVLGYTDGTVTAYQSLQQIRHIRLHLLPNDTNQSSMKVTGFVQNILGGFPALSRTFCGLFSDFPAPCMAWRSTSFLVYGHLGDRQLGDILTGRHILVNWATTLEGWLRMYGV